MGWEELLADLEAQFEAEFEAEQARELSADVAERARAEQAAVGLRERLRAGLGSSLSLGTVDGTTWRGSLRSTGPDWLLLGIAEGGEVLVALAAVTWFAGLPERPAPSDAAARRAARIDLRIALRRLARDRAPVRFHLCDRSSQEGTVVRVGVDVVDLRLHDAGEDVRAATGSRALPLAAVVAVRRR